MKKIEERIIAIENKSRELEQEVLKKTFKYVIASFGLVAGLAWNEAIKAFIEVVFPLQNDTMIAKFIYAAVITIVVVLVSLYFPKFFKKEEPEAEEKKSA